MVYLQKKNGDVDYWTESTYVSQLTGNQLLRDYEELGQWKKVAAKYNCSSAYIIKLRKRFGVFKPALTKGKGYGGQNSKHTKNGGKRVCSRGYIIVGRYHPDNHREEDAHEHLLVMEKYLNRRLAPGECVHHIDGDKTNNCLSNLFLCNHSLHRKAEESAIRLIYEFLKDGDVIFEDGQYKKHLAKKKLSKGESAK